ncbi:M15 family metallopeptidase [Hymenobacter canadensis]|uniref:D-alanyl-D-alanine dipeptidase n=1 Tax=Hymenobacter canadensis TaxID=2999067 RepID=A0ABY7LUU2_9BACT|nr:M15 family metallopeptidase [Hymenobacter canadensis]WBA43796.1 M15 family metallopeptidase [Hymenobacter canadensis]
MTEHLNEPTPAGPRVLSAAEYRQLVQRHPDHALVNLAEVVPGLRLDIRYATPHNLLGAPLYARAAALLARPAALDLVRVQAALARHGAGLLVYDAYRPYRATVRLWEKVQDEQYAAPPWRGSRHNRGASLDVGLVDLATGHPLPMPTEFDDLTPAAHTAYEPVSAPARRHRGWLLAAMSAHGFVNYPGEWWHFDHHRWAEFDLLDVPL